MESKYDLPYVDDDGDYDPKLDPEIHAIRRRKEIRKATIDAFGSVALFAVFEVMVVAVMLGVGAMALGVIFGFVKTG
jgi:hypothetical protein